MKFLSLTASNLFSLGEDVELNLDNQGLLLIRGWSFDENNENGAGKSSLISKALTWTIYGKTIGGTTGDKVINRHTGIKHCGADLYFQADDGERYCIIRTRNPNTLKLFKLTKRDANSKGEVFGTNEGNYDYDDVSLKTAKATQERIEALIGRSFDTFRQAEFFGQSRPQSFFQLTPAAQTETVQSILPISQLDDWAEKAKEVYKEMGEQESHFVLESASKKTALEEVHHQVRIIQGKSIAWLAAHGERLDELEDNITVFNNKNKDIPSQIEEFEGRISQYNMKELDALFDKTNEEMAENKVKIEKFDIEKNEAIKLRTQWDSHKEKLQDALNRVRNSIRDKCDTCGQKIPQETIKKLEVQAEGISDQLLECFTPMFDATETKTKCSTKIWVIEDDTRNKQKILNDVVRSKNEYTSLLRDLQALEKRDISSSIAFETKLLEEEQGRVDPFTDIIVELVERAGILHKEITEVDLAISDLKQSLTKVHFWIQAYSKHIKTYLLNQACPFLQERTNAYLSELGNPQISVQFSTIKDLISGDSRDQFNVVVSSVTGGAEFDLLSGGEQQIASCAVGLALADLANTQATGSSNIIILDEPFDSLSPKNSAAVVEFLTTKLPKETVLLISNEAGMMELIPNSIRVIKRGGISSIE